MRYAFWNGFVESNSPQSNSSIAAFFSLLLSISLLLSMVYLSEWFVSLAIQLSDESSIFNAVHHISCLCPKFNCTFPSRSQQYSSDLVRHDLEVKFCFFVVIGLFLCYNRPPFKIYSVVKAKDVFHEHSWNHFVFLAGTWN